MLRIRTITKASTYLKNYILQARAKRNLLPAIDDVDCWLALDPISLYAAEIDGKVIGTLFLFKYDDGYRMAGGFYIDEKYRNQGYGFQLNREVVKRAEPTTNLSLYTSPHLVEMSKRILGVRDLIYTAERREFDILMALKKLQNIPMNSTYEIKEVSEVDFEALVNYDKFTFGYDHREFLYKWLFSPVSQSFVALNNDGSVVGYVVARESLVPNQGYTITPLYCEDIDVGLSLLRSVLQRIKEQGTSTSNLAYMHSPVDKNPQVNEFLEFIESRRDLKYLFLTSNGEPNGRLEKCFSVSSFNSG
ncbi:uncharacterized protein LOC114529363 [Dendronephthya gigantea]|uniref:uncharacterized protein LOC114529363 n=1 Tax=Dendronephthya gigantea TaxID=151771 RepID=UPI00106D9FB8|nr:uncharacterized protein LOC114529363 [Dendronephthya gigantea]